MVDMQKIHWKTSCLVTCILISDVWCIMVNFTNFASYMKSAWFQEVKSGRYLEFCVIITMHVLDVCMYATLFLKNSWLQKAFGFDMYQQNTVPKINQKNGIFVWYTERRKKYKFKNLSVTYLKLIRWCLYFYKVNIGFFIDIILPIALWPWRRLSL